MTRAIDRRRGVQGLPLLFNPRSVPAQVPRELAGFYGFSPKEAGGCLADIMISQRKGEFPPVAFVIVHRDSENATPSQVSEKIQRVDKAFVHVFGIIVLPVPRHAELQCRLIQTPTSVKIFTVTSLTSAVHLMASIHGKLSVEIAARADRLYDSMRQDFLSRQYALQVLQTNFPFLKLDECDMLLDLFGGISNIAQATAADILDVTVLDSVAAHAVEEFFQSEYALE